MRSKFRIGLRTAGTGKTTAIREMSRLVADTIGKRVIIVDTSNEIGGDGDIPHPGIGRARRMQVASVDLQHKTMIEAVENHMPQVRLTPGSDVPGSRVAGIVKLQDLTVIKAGGGRIQLRQVLKSTSIRGLHMKENRSPYM
jgi:hypothetical protein